MLTANLKILGIVIVICAFCYGNAARYRKVGDLALVMDLIEHQYVDESKSEDLYNAAMKGMVDSLDPYSGFVPPSSIVSFRSVLEQEFGGLGVSLDGPPRRDRFTVVSALFDSPAYRAGIKPGDVILEVDGQKVNGLQFEQLTSKLRGKEGTKVQLLLQRANDSEPFTVDVTRDIIEVESVLGDQRKEDGSWDYRLAVDPSIAYLRIELFGEKTHEELKKAIEGLGNISGLIIDLRDNSGGLLESAITICDYFLDEGVVVETKGRQKADRETFFAKPGVLVPKDVPVAVLVNQNSASASEIMAACLQDNCRAKVVGMRTFGKGSVQNVIPLDGGRAALRLTTAYYFPPSGKMIHRRKDAKDEDSWGVMPDPGCEIDIDASGLEALIDRLRKRSDPTNYVVPENLESSPDVRDPTLSADPQLKKALELLQSSKTAA
ncbi:MAG: S41 family peptidase [Pirellula sp.]|jgi:carboxyl-terminal processing protease|nr:S41 family peptidase [Pirellula sp.]